LENIPIAVGGRRSANAYSPFYGNPL